jgi:Xaa-Pro aminopeptidase
VHEGPHSISPRPGNATPLRTGMVVSNEPGYYAPGQFGIRIENLLTVESAEEGLHRPGGLSAGGRKFLGFSALTLVPIQTARLVDTALLSTAELDWIDAYHARVWETVGPLVDEASGARDWLRRMTAPIDRQ